MISFSKHFINSHNVFITVVLINIIYIKCLYFIVNLLMAWVCIFNTEPPYEDLHVWVHVTKQQSPDKMLKMK